MVPLYAQVGQLLQRSAAKALRRAVRQGEGRNGTGEPGQQLQQHHQRLCPARGRLVGVRRRSHPRLAHA